MGLRLSCFDQAARKARTLRGGHLSTGVTFRGALGSCDHPQTFAQDVARGAEVAILRVAADGTDEGAISQRQGAVPAPSPAPGLQRWEDAARAEAALQTYCGLLRACAGVRDDVRFGVVLRGDAATI